MFTRVQLFYKPSCRTWAPKMQWNLSMQKCTSALSPFSSSSRSFCPVLEVTSPHRFPVSSILLTLGASPLPYLSKTDTVPQRSPGSVPFPLSRLTVSLIWPLSLVVSRHGHENWEKDFFQELQSKRLYISKLCLCDLHIYIISSFTKNNVGKISPTI